MTRNVAKKVVSMLVHQANMAIDRLIQFEKENILGLEHTAMREQLNQTAKTLAELKEKMPHPYLPIDFNSWTETCSRAKKQFSWFGWI